MLGFEYDSFLTSDGSISHAPQSVVKLDPAPIAAPPTEPVLPEVLDEPSPIDVEAQLEERRRKRREILERFAGTQSGSSSVAAVGVSTENPTASATPSVTADPTRQSTPVTAGPVSMRDDSFEAGTFDLSKSNDITNKDHRNANGTTDNVLPDETRANVVDGELQISAADYNPDEDRRMDEAKERDLLAASRTKQQAQNGVASGIGEPAPHVIDVTKDAGEESEYEEIEVDAEDDDDFDMFAVDEPPKKKIVRRKKQVGQLSGTRIEVVKADVLVTQNTTAVAPPSTATAPASLHASIDNYDDHEGYYRITPGEVMDSGRYKITVNLGKGMFAQVIRATVIQSFGVDKGERKGDEVAIKVIRSQESM